MRLNSLPVCLISVPTVCHGSSALVRAESGVGPISGGQKHTNYVQSLEAREPSTEHRDLKMFCALPVQDMRMSVAAAAFRVASGRREIRSESSAGGTPDASIQLKMDFPSQMAAVSKDPPIRDQFSSRPFDLVQRDSTNNNTDVAVPIQTRPRLVNFPNGGEFRGHAQRNERRGTLKGTACNPAGGSDDHGTAPPRQPPPHNTHAIPQHHQRISSDLPTRSFRGDTSDDSLSSRPLCRHEVQISKHSDLSGFLVS